MQLPACNLRFRHQSHCQGGVHHASLQPMQPALLTMVDLACLKDWGEVEKYATAALQDTVLRVG